MIPQSELEKLRTDVAAALTDKCTIVHRSFVSDGSGGTREMLESTPNVPCLVVMPSKQAESVIADSIQGRQSVVILVADNTEIDRNCVIEMGQSKYEVIATDPRTNRVLKNIICVLVN